MLKDAYMLEDHRPSGDFAKTESWDGAGKGGNMVLKYSLELRVGLSTFSA